MKTPKLLLDRLPADFHRRLENWGEVMRDRRHQGVSPTYEVCRALAKRAGQGAWGSDDPEKEWNEADADLIERAWRLGAAYRMHPRAPLLLRAYYVANQPPFVICRMQGIRAREFDDHLVRGVTDFQHFVAQMESRMHNPAQSVMTTV